MAGVLQLVVTSMAVAIAPGWGACRAGALLLDGDDADALLSEEDAPLRPPPLPPPAELPAPVELPAFAIAPYAPVAGARSWTVACRELDASANALAVATEVEARSNHWTCHLGVWVPKYMQNSVFQFLFFLSH